MKMLKQLLKKRVKKHAQIHCEVTPHDIENAESILFSVFARYGDGIISFKIINALITKYPQKRYAVLTTRQHLPYAKAIIKSENVTFLKVNKRNPWELYRTVRYLRKEHFDLGFNPWGHGDDSEFFLTYCKKFSFFKKMDSFSKTDNLYDRVRYYLHLPVQTLKVLREPTFTSVNNVLIAPISSDVTKNIDTVSLERLIGQLKQKFDNPTITVSIPKGYEKMAEGVEQFVFSKSTKASSAYVRQMLDTDLFVGVDSGPLHLALALGVESIAVFGPTAPFTILDNNDRVKVVRDQSLHGIFCFVKSCKDPICIKRLFEKGIFNCTYDEETTVDLEEAQCPLK